MEGRKCSAPACANQADVFVAVVHDQSIAAEHTLCNPHANNFFTSFAPRYRTAMLTEVAEFELELVASSIVGERGVFTIRQANKNLRVVIPCGPVEVWSLYWRLKRPDFPRILPHWVIANLIEVLGARPLEISVCDFEAANARFGARLVLEHAGSHKTVDIRASDGIHLSLNCRVPFVVQEQVLQQLHTAAYQYTPGEVLGCISE